MRYDLSLRNSIETRATVHWRRFPPYFLLLLPFFREIIVGNEMKGGKGVFISFF